VFFAIWFFAGLAAYSGFEVMGESDKTLESYVASNYYWFNIFFQISILLVITLTGAAAGFLSGVFARRAGGGRIAAYGLPPLLWMTAVLSLLVRQPQFFDGPFLDSKPWLRALVFSPTRWLEPYMADSSLALIALCLVAVPVMNAAIWVTRYKSRVALVAVLALGWRTWDGAFAALSSPQKKKPNVLLVVIDSLRSDHLSINGYERKTTPVIDSIAAQGAVFEKVIVDVPRTFPSWVSMMTGQYAMTHGVRHMFPTEEQRRLIYPPLPKIMSESGWQTAVVADFAGDIFPRMDLGFQRTDAPDFTFDDLVKIRNLEIHPTAMAFLNNRAGETLYPSIREMVDNCDPRTLTDRVIATLRSFDRKKPFFLSVFFSATHIPYAVTGPYYRKFSDPAYEGPYLFQKKNLLMTKDDVTPADRQHLIDLYDGALYAVDEQIGRMLSELKSLGYGDDTIITVTGDHGENFYEHRAEIGHGNHLRGPYAITPPLVIQDTRRPFTVKKVKWQARSIDLAPTLADMAGVKMPATAGSSLVPMLDGREKNNRLAYSETGLWYVNEGPFFFQKMRINYPNVTGLCEIDDEWRKEVVIKERYQPLVVAAKHRMVSDGKYKLIVMPTENGPVSELYDLQADPEEKNDISKTNPEALALMTEKLKEVELESADTVFYRGMAFARQDFEW